MTVQTLNSAELVGEVIHSYIAAYGPVSVASIRHECKNQTNVTAYVINEVLTGILNSEDVEVYDLTDGDEASFWHSTAYTLANA